MNLAGVDDAEGAGRNRVTGVPVPVFARGVEAEAELVLLVDVGR